jgi:hypothetical protein
VTEIAFLSATEQAALVRGRQVSPVELVSTYLERIEKFNPTLNAFVTVTADLAMDAARRAEAAVATGGELPQGQCHLPRGVPAMSSKGLKMHVPIRTAKPGARHRRSPRPFRSFATPAQHLTLRSNGT